MMDTSRYPTPQFEQLEKDGPSHNLRRRTRAGGLLKQIEYDLPPTPGTPLTPMKSTRSAVKRLYASSLEEDLDMCGKRLKYVEPPSPSPCVPLSLMSAAGPYLDDVTLEKTRLKQRKEESSDLDTPEKKKLSLEVPTANLTLDFPITFEGFMDSLDPHTDRRCPELTEPYSHSSVDDNELNTPRPSPPSSPILSPLNPQTPMTPQTPATPSKSTRSRKRPLSPLSHMRQQSRSLMDIEDVHEWRFVRDGAIVELTMTDFMKYKKKHFTWGPHLNVITGDNGAGKTTTQTAIMFVLGANASTTGRNDSLKKFIRRGATKAVVVMVITNYNGTHSKRRFGELIKLERVLTKSRNILRIQNGDGTWIEKVKKMDWDLFLRPLQIHLSNPVQFLTQKTATEFLQNTDYTALFKGFEDVTLIAPAEEFLKIAQFNIRECNGTLGKKAIDQEEYAKKGKELNERCKRIDEMKKYKIEIVNEYYWALVKQEEDAKQKTEEEKAKFDVKIEKEEAVKKAAEQKRIEMKNADKSEKSGLSNLKVELDALGIEQEDARNTLREATKEDKAIQQRIKLTQGYLQKLRNELTELENKLQDNLAHKATDEERKKQSADRQIAEHQETIRMYELELAELKAQRAQAIGQKDMCERVEEEHKANLRAVMSQLGDKEKEMKKIKHHENTKYDRFGNDMKRLVDKVEKGKWHGPKPLGPVGAWLTVNESDSIYAPLVEETLGRTLRSFVINHPEDVKTLRQMIADVYGNKRNGVPGIISVNSSGARNGAWWSKGKAVVDGIPTLLDVLDIKHAKVTEALIEKEQIERILLFKTHGDACDVLKDHRRVPRTCVYGLSLECYKYTPTPNFAAKPLNRRTKATILTTTQFDDVGAIVKEIEALKAEQSTLRKIHEEAKRNLDSAMRIVAKLTEDIKSKTQEVHRAMSLLRTCEQKRSQITDTATDNDLIEERRVEIQASITEQEAELKIQQQKLEANSKILQDKEQKYQSYNAKIQTLQNRIKSCSDEAVVLKRQYDEIDKTIRKCEVDIKNLKEQRQILQKHCNDITKQIKLRTKMALTKGDRVDTTRASSEIKSDYEGLKKFYKENRHLIRAKEAMRKAGIRWQKLAEAMLADITFVRDFLKKTLEPIVNSQAKHLSKKEEECFQCFENYYKTFIERRGYGGEVIYDVKDQKLLYYMTVDHDSAVKIQTYLKVRHDGSRQIDWRGLKDFIMGLSGGEKSFTNLAYIAALRQIMPSPFFMLDEFEVFMDAANRKASCDILVDQANNQNDAQFFVFTPGELEFPQSDTIKLFILKKNEDDE